MLRPFALATIAVTLLPTARGQQAPRQLDLSNDTARQVVVDREAGQYLGHVSTVLLDDGRTILAVYPKGHGKGAIVLKRSSDGGRTWSERLPVPASWATSREVPTIWRTADAGGKRHLMLWSGLYPARLAHSDDDGATWSELEPAGEWGGIVVMGDVAATHTPGRYLAWFHDDGRFLADAGSATGTFTLLQTESRDGGRSWSAPRPLWSGSDMHLCEPGCVRLQSGALALLLRENARRAPSQWIASLDDGATWSKPEPLHPALCGDRHTVRRAADGRLVAVFRAMPRDDDKDYLATKGDFVAWVGTDEDLLNGAGQLRVRLLDNRDGWDCGYPGLEVLPDGTFVATTYGHWQDGEPPYIVAVRFTLAELEALADRAATAQGLDADLATLLAYQPTQKAPTDPEVVAAEARLMKAMGKVVTRGGAFADRLAELHRERADKLVPSAKNRIRARDPLARALVRFDDERTLQMPVNRLRAHPSAAAFPGAAAAGTAPGAVGKVVDLSVPGRHSLAAFAPAGGVVNVQFGDGETAPPKGLRLRIGAHSDDIARRDAWPRMPRISRTFAVDAAKVTIGSAYGGLVYLEAPNGATGQLDVLLDGVVQAPLFELGVTSVEDWQLLRKAPGPWAELGTDKVILTVPATAIRDLADPTPVLQFWNLVLDGAADLAARSRVRTRPERYVADLEISAGAMHSGYPIMTHLNAAADMVDLARMQKGPWGLFHELGHNHQNRDWTFAGTTEVTVNLFSLYLCHTLCNVPWDQAWGGNLARARDRFAEILRRGEKPWGKDGAGKEEKPDLALRLLMYSQLERGFGWEAFMHAFAEYRDLPAEQRPKTDQDKRDMWFERLSRGVDRDLGPFFRAWGVEVSDAALATAKGRLVWLPDDWPN